jgi:hypothetical protein
MTAVLTVINETDPLLTRWYGLDQDVMVLA